MAPVFKIISMLGLQRLAVSTPILLNDRPPFADFEAILSSLKLLKWSTCQAVFFGWLQQQTHRQVPTEIGVPRCVVEQIAHCRGNKTESKTGCNDYKNAALEGVRKRKGLKNLVVHKRPFKKMAEHVFGRVCSLGR
jgi:hypothetical protein